MRIVKYKHCYRQNTLAWHCTQQNTTAFYQEIRKESELGNSMFFLAFPTRSSNLKKLKS